MSQIPTDSPFSGMIVLGVSQVYDDFDLNREPYLDDNHLSKRIKYALRLELRNGFDKFLEQGPLVVTSTDDPKSFGTKYRTTVGVILDVDQFVKDMQQALIDAFENGKKEQQENG